MLVNKYVCNQINRQRVSRFFSIIDSKRVSEAALGVRKKNGKKWGGDKREEGGVGTTKEITRSRFQTF